MHLWLSKMQSFTHHSLFQREVGIRFFDLSFPSPLLIFRLCDVPRIQEKYTSNINRRSPAFRFRLFSSLDYTVTKFWMQLFVQCYRASAKTWTSAEENFLGPRFVSDLLQDQRRKKSAFKKNEGWCNLPFVAMEVPENRAIIELRWEYYLISRCNLTTANAAALRDSIKRTELCRFTTATSRTIF